jgi:DNA-directed RNA polymerase beta subunit
MDIQHTGAAPERVDFSKIKTSIPIPNLIEVQKKSYERFLQMDLLPNEREDIGLQTVFNSVFPISDFRGVSDLEFVDYSIGNWEGCTTCVPPAAVAAPPSAPIPSTPATFSAIIAAPLTRTW